MKRHDKDIEDELRSWLNDANNVVVAGIGNAIRSDDFVGVKVVMGLQGKVSPAVTLIECETVPESFVDEIVGIRPSHVLLVDAALLGLGPGDAHLYEAEEVINVPSISTHTLPLRVFCEYVKKLTGAKIALVLIEPKNVDFGEGLSEEVEEGATRVEAAILSSLP